MADRDSGGRRVLIVEDELCIRDTLCELFNVPGVSYRAAADLPAALAALAAETFELIITDLRLGGKRDGGLQVMGAAGMLSPDATLIVLTAFPDSDNRHASLRLGAARFLEKPVDLGTIAALAAERGIPTAAGEVSPHAGGRQAPG